jgi:peptidoglycan/LPS O-acetylase OafA/YrhL
VQSSSNSRIASLDGLRAISIGLVIFGHLVGTSSFPIRTTVWAPFLASVGVRVFFVVSGFLITGLLLAEREKYGSVRLSSFYFRRAFRILVPYYAFLAVAAVAARGGLIKLGPGDMAYALAYASNYHWHGTWAFGHTWSLAVEEQFYLLWPALIVMLGVRRSMLVAGAYLAIAPCWRIVVWYFFPGAHDGIGHTFGTVADSIAAGCLLAGVREKFWQDTRYRAFLASRWFVVVPLVVVATVAVQGGASRLHHRRRHRKRGRRALPRSLPALPCRGLDAAPLDEASSSWDRRATRSISGSNSSSTGRRRAGPRPFP